MKKLLPVTVLLLLAMFMMPHRTVLAQLSEDDTTETQSIHLSFGDPGTPAATITHNFNMPSDGYLTIQLKDCCIRDDIVETYIDGTFVWIVDSRYGATGTHPWQWLTVPFILSAGPHTITFINILSETPGPSGWDYDLHYGGHPAPLFSDVLAILSLGLIAGVAIVRRRRR